MGHPLVVCEVLCGNPQGAECSECGNPCWLSITKVTYWPRFLLNTDEEKHKASYRGTADIRLYTFQNDSEATSRCQEEKPKTVHTASNNKRFAKNRCCVLNQHLPGYELSVWKLSGFLL